jgi:hypothetical protein
MKIPNRIIGTKLGQRDYELKLAYIQDRWNLTPEVLISLFDGEKGIQLLQGLPGETKRKFREYLKRLDTIMPIIAERLSGEMVITDRLNDPTMKEYFDQIRNSLGLQAFGSYIRGEWTEDIFQVVSRAQREHMIPSSPKSREQLESRASFVPSPDYHPGWKARQYRGRYREIK